MKEVHFGSKAKKDLKRYRNNIDKIRKLYNVLNLLANDLQLPKEYKTHYLTGNYQNCLECHIENDFLLIWIDTDKNIIDVLRIGSHSELFK